MDLRATHLVQSYRGLIERMFAQLKMFQILQGGQCDSIVTKEMELDCAMALHNLITRERLGLMGDIPARAPHAPSAHIITPSRQDIVKLPKKIDLASPLFPTHLTQFREFLTTHVGEISRALADASPDQIFSSRVEARGRNLYQGGNILQMGARHVNDGQWIIRVLVGASMKGVSYNCYVRMQLGSHHFETTCECIAGYVGQAVAEVLERVLSTNTLS